MPSVSPGWLLGRIWEVHEQVGVAAVWLAQGTGGTQGVGHTHSTDTVSCPFNKQGRRVKYPKPNSVLAFIVYRCFKYFCSL